jgi:hypothetical protein
MVPVRTRIVYTLQHEKASRVPSLCGINSFGAIAPYMGQKRGTFLRECISLKNWSYRPLLRDSTSPFKSTCLLTKLLYVPGALHTPNTCSELTYIFLIWPY